MATPKQLSTTQQFVDFKGLPPALARQTAPPDFQAPSTAFDLFSSFRDVLPSAPQLAPQLEQTGFRPITGLPGEFFESQRERLKEDLRHEFFGPLGQVQQVASGESAAGRLGSGVGSRVIEEAAIRPFAQASTDIDARISELQLQENARVEQFNAEQFNLYTDRLFKLREGDRAVELELNNLALDAANAEAGRLSQQAIAKLDSDLRVWEASLSDFRKEQTLLLEAEKNELERQRLGIEFIRSPIELPDEFSDPLIGSLLESFGVQSPTPEEQEERRRALHSPLAKGPLGQLIPQF